jgi:hypothetical protein
VTKVHGRNGCCYVTGDVMHTGKLGLSARTTVMVTKYFTSALRGLKLQCNRGHDRNRKKGTSSKEYCQCDKELKECICRNGYHYAAMFRVRTGKW